MVVRLTNDTMRFLPQIQYAPPPEAEDYPADTGIGLVLPVLIKAKTVLLERLVIVDEETLFLDNTPASLTAVVMAANAIVAKLGGKPLPWPGARPNYTRDGMAMRICQPCTPITKGPKS